MPRIRCHYEDCVFLEDGYCGTTEIELDPETGCLTYTRYDELPVDEEEDWEDEELFEEEEEWEEEDEDLYEDEEEDDDWDDEEY